MKGMKNALCSASMHSCHGSMLRPTLKMDHWPLVGTMRVTTKHVGLSVDANMISCDCARHTESTQSDMADVSVDDR